MDDIRIAASVSSRICHDLVSPVGAVVNGVDLVREMGAADHTEAIGMIGQSAERASALLQLYRIAFGTAEPDGQGVPRGALAEHAAVLFAPPRIVLEWQGREGPTLPRREARLLTLLLLCGRAILGVRGSILLRTPPREAMPLSVEVRTDNLSTSADLLPLLENGANGKGPVTPRSVEFILAQDAAQDLDVRIDVQREPGRITISAS